MYNVQVGIDVTNESLFFIRLYQVKEQDKTVFSKEIKSSITDVFRERFSANSSPGMLISREVT